MYIFFKWTEACATPGIGRSSFSRLNLWFWMDPSLNQWFESPESELEMRSSVKNSTVPSSRAHLMMETLMVLMSLGAVTGEFTNCSTVLLSCDHEALNELLDILISEHNVHCNHFLLRNVMMHKGNV